MGKMFKKTYGKKGKSYVNNTTKRKEELDISHGKKEHQLRYDHHQLSGNNCDCDF